MKNYILNIIVGIICTALLTSGHSSYIKAFKYTVNIHKASYLIIEGKTNVGKFDCAFEGKVLHDTIEVILTEDENGCLNFVDLEFLLPVREFDCENALMNKDFQELLKYNSYPYISWEILCMDIAGMDKKDQQAKDTLQINTLLKIAGEEREYWIPVIFERRESMFSFSGNLLINIRDFQLEPPTKVFGLVQVCPAISIDFAIEVSLI